MQIYPGDDYTPHCYTGVLDDVDDYVSYDDYHYNSSSNAIAHPSMPTTLRKGVSHQKMHVVHAQHAPHRSMQKMLDKGVPRPKQNYTCDNNYGNSEYQYKGGSTMEMKPNHQWMPPKNHGNNYNNKHGYGGYDQNFDNFTQGHEDYNVQYSEDWHDGHEDYNVQYSEDWHENEDVYDTWKESNDHFGLGKHQNSNKYSGTPYGVEKSGGYGAHQRPHMPTAEQRPYHIPAAHQGWNIKGIKD